MITTRVRAAEPRLGRRVGISGSPTRHGLFRCSLPEVSSGSSSVELVDTPINRREFIPNVVQSLKVGPTTIPCQLRLFRAVHPTFHYRDRCRVLGLAGLSRSTGRWRCAPRSPARMSRTRRDKECGVMGCNGKGSAPHWSIGGNTGTSVVLSSKVLVDRHRCGDSVVTASALSMASAMTVGVDLGDREIHDAEPTGDRARPAQHRLSVGRERRWRRPGW